MASRKEASGGLIAGDDWNPIKNINDPHVVDIAQFAVPEYDKRSGAFLKLVKIIYGYTQVVSGGINYSLILSTSSGSITSNYEAIVFENNSQNSKKLTSFKLIND